MSLPSAKPQPGAPHSQDPAQRPAGADCSVQGFGCLIAVSPDWLIIHASDNSGAMLGLPAEDIPGTRFEDRFDETAAHMLRGKTQTLIGEDSVARAAGVDLFADGRRFDVSVHHLGRGFAFEFEPAARAAGTDDLSLIQPLIARIRAQKDFPDLLAEAARAMRGLTGYDRVAVIRFEQDGSGRAVGESCHPEMDRCLGLHFPPGDIAGDETQLHRSGQVRLIADIEADTFSVVPSRSPEGDPCDLSLCVLRAAAPARLQQLRDMGLRAAMSLPILRRGALWGMFACHHRQPRQVDFGKRTAVELFAQLAAGEISERLNTEERAEAAQARSLHDRLMKRVSRSKGLAGDFPVLAEEIWDAIDFDGIALFSGGTYHTLGSAPTEAEFAPLARFLNTTAASAVFATDRLSACYDGASGIADRVAGLLVLPIARQRRDFIVLFRREITRIVKWAGSPADAARAPEGPPPDTGPAGWREVVKGRSAPWTAGELMAAETLRVTLLEIELRAIDRTSARQRRAHEKQELLVAELNHRVRNILNIIRGVVAQGGNDSTTVAEFTEVLDSRIQSLARAHDQLTLQEWASVSLRGLIGVEAEAFCGARSNRVVITGEDVQLVPDAFSTVALVVHELVTNSVKHGALSRPEGRVAIALSRDDGGALVIRWRESGGPPVVRPDRRGFGTTIIERSIPFELNGLSDIRFGRAGVEVDLTIPPRHFSAEPPPAPRDRAVATPSEPDAPRETGPDPLRIAAVPDTPDASLLHGDVLLLEDNLIIAMAAQDKLERLGARAVHIAGSVRDALALIRRMKLEFAVLDVNLRGETSTEVAQELARAKIPFILATGYETVDGADRAYPDAPVLTKPYTSDGLARVAARAYELAGVRGRTR